MRVIMSVVRFGPDASVQTHSHEPWHSWNRYDVRKTNGLKIAHAVMNMETAVLDCEGHHAVVQPSPDRMCVQVECVESQYEGTRWSAKFAFFDDRVDVGDIQTLAVGRTTTGWWANGYMRKILMFMNVKTRIPDAAHGSELGVGSYPFERRLSEMYPTSIWAHPYGHTRMWEHESEVEALRDEEEANYMRLALDFFYSESRRDPRLAQQMQPPEECPRTSNAGTTVRG